MEKRKKERIDYKTFTDITCRKKSFRSGIENISLEGILINSPEVLEPGETCDVTIVLEGAATRLTASLTGRVLRSDGGKTAINFTDISTDSYVHLRNIISNRTMDTEKITREFESIKLDKDVSD